MPDMNLRAIPVMRTALEQIQELHGPMPITIGLTLAGDPITQMACSHCTAISEEGIYFEHPCATRKMADAGLEGAK